MSTAAGVELKGDEDRSGTDPFSLGYRRPEHLVVGVRVFGYHFPVPSSVMPVGMDGTDRVTVMASAPHEDLREKLGELGPWYHYIEFENGLNTTPGDRDQSLVFDLYRSLLPADLTGKTVLDLGANAAGLSIEFAHRGAQVTAVESASRYCTQARFVVDHFNLADRIQVVHADVYSLVTWTETFDIVCYFGLSYHLRYPQLALDLLSHLCGDQLLCSSQTMTGDTFTMRNRAEGLPDSEYGNLHGWEPTENLFLRMLAHARFRNPKLVSTAPHSGETAHRKCGNRSYFVADAPLKQVPLPW